MSDTPRRRGSARKIKVPSNSAPPEAIGSCDNRAPLSLLLVEDDPNDALIIRTLLQRSKHFDCSIVWASDLKSARHEADHGVFDVMILDFWVKAEDSLQILAGGTDPASLAPAIVISSLDMTDVQAQSLSAGALAYLHKNDLSSCALDASLRTLLHIRERETRLARSLQNEASEHARLRSSTADMAQEALKALGAVQNFAKMMSDQAQSSPFYSQQIRSGSAQLSQILQRYMGEVGARDISSELRYEDACLIETVEAATLAFEKACAEKSQPIEIISTCDELRAQFDRAAIYQSLINLLANAHQYSAMGAPIRVTIDDLGPEARIAVIDQGVGMSQDQVVLALQRYARIVPPAELAANGGGLGLAIVTSIVDIHGGSLEIESFKDWGTTVAIRLPKRRPTLN